MLQVFLLLDNKIYFFEKKKDNETGHDIHQVL